MPENSVNVSRRSVLKRAAGVAAGAGVVAGASGVGAAAPTAEIAILTTERYEDEYSSPSGTLYDVNDYCYNEWQDYLDNSIYTATQDIGIPEDELRVPTDYYARPSIIDQWLRGELREQDRNREHYLYDQYEAFLVLDHVAESEITYNALGYNAELPGQAGSRTMKTAAVNAWYADAGFPDYGFIENVGLEGASLHEACHLFGAEHADAEVVGQKASIMFTSNDQQPPDCGYVDDPDDVETTGHWLSECTVDAVDGFLNDNFD